MRSIEAVRLINSMLVKPGWEVSAKCHPHDPYTVLVKTRLISVDSSDWKNGYKAPIDQAVVNTLDVSGYGSDDDLVAGIIALFMGYELHEWREFARIPVGDEYVAPFHPHTPEGMANGWRHSVIRAIGRACYPKGFSG